MRRTILIPNTYSPRGPLAEKLALLANRLHWITRQKRDYINGFYFHFGTRAWHGLFSGHYMAVKKAARESGLIEVNDSYVVGERPKSLRLRKEHRLAGPGFFLVRDKLFKKLDRSDSLGEVGLHLQSKFHELCFRPGVEAEIARIANPRSRVICQYAHADVVLHNFSASRCEYGRRFHSNFGRLKRPIRKYLSHQEERLVELDIKSSQPLLMTVGLETMETTYKHPNINTKPNTSISCLPDVVHWRKLCESGQFYEYFLSRIREMGIDSYTFRFDGTVRECFTYYWTRNQVKKAFMQAIFGKEDPDHPHVFMMVVDRDFPSIAAFVRETKRDDYKAMARWCQRKESEIVIERICGRLMRAYPEQAILTIHDAILCRKSFRERCEEVIQQEFGKYGLRPRLSRKLLNGRWTRRLKVDEKQDALVISQTGSP